MRINIKTGKIILKREHKKHHKVCIICGKEWEGTIRNKRPNKYCSVSCSHKTRTKKEKKVIPVEQQREKWRLQKQKQRMTKIKKPRFMKNNLVFVRKVYDNFLLNGVIPKKNSTEYGLYLYGEWLYDNGLY